MKCACGCGRELPTTEYRGQPRRYLNASCRARAAEQRARGAAAAELAAFVAGDTDVLWGREMGALEAKAVRMGLKNAARVGGDDG